VAFPEAIDGLGKLLKKSTVNGEDVARRVLTRYSDDVVEATFKGINKGVIDDLWDVDAEDLAKYIKNWDGDPFNPTEAKHELMNMYKSPKTTTAVGDDTIDGIAVLKKGSATEDWGWEHIVDQDHNQHIKNAFGLTDDDQAVKGLIGDGLKRGTVDPKNKWRIIYTPPDSDKTLRVVMSSSSPGSIQDAYPVSV
jgi:hypothetical protein